MKLNAVMWNAVFNEHSELSPHFGQSENHLWQTARKFRFTSSNSHDVVTRKKENLDKFLLKFTQTDKYIDTPALRLGRKHEPIARKKYVVYKKLKHNEKVNVLECGIFLCKKFGYLGASPNGIVTKKSEACQPWVLEIKCPFKWRFKTVRRTCRDRDFCCEINSENEIQLRKSHHYYSQIQGQMSICQCLRCDFVIYLLKDFSILKVDLDQEYWEATELKLSNFYNEYMIPFIIKSANHDQ
ncbi:unnamed protein product [Mytilus coruscus]|uniref:YqaJ viral recombinase domain-containing protein n=1 Tax=Mytilus coruscus TaxID=42192 RepID=A0A6J8AHQ2_MYTCO|nr:unnamed protein product [Mytilus coruscus]